MGNPFKDIPLQVRDRLLRELKLLRLRSFLMLTLAGIINAFGVVFFLFPVKLYDSGISGLSMLLDQVTPPWRAPTCCCAPSSAASSPAWAAGLPSGPAVPLTASTCSR